MASEVRESAACTRTDNPMEYFNIERASSSKPGETTVDHDVLQLRYGVNDRPPVGLIILLALQNVMFSFNSTMIMSFTIADVACAERNDPIRVKLFCTSAIVVGMTTILQSACGIRIPVFQGVSCAFLGPLLSIRPAGLWSCDTGDEYEELGMTSNNITILQNVTMATKQELVSNRITQLQGSLMASALVTEVFLGATGLLGDLARLVGPITVCATITSLALSLHTIVIHYSSAYLPVTASGVVLMTLCILYLTRILVPLPTMHCVSKKRVPRDLSEDNDKLTQGQTFPIFQIFAVSLTVVVTWALCGVLTMTGALPDDPRDPAYRARTDTGGDLISQSPWIFFPYPGQFGPPRFHTAIFLGFVIALLSSTMESIGDYMTISRITETYPPPPHAVNRGILLEGVMGVVAGALGTGHATTSYSTNTVIVKLTQVASRMVMILAGLICVLFGVIGKVGAIMASVPDPVLGGVSVVSFGMLAAIGLSSLQRVNISSTRNLGVLGVSLYLGLVTSEWMKTNGDSIDTGNASIDQILKVILGTQMFVAGATSIILDNTVRGTKKERGMEEMTSFEAQRGSEFDKHRLVYDVPGIRTLQKSIPCFRHIPFLQPYTLE